MSQKVGLTPEQAVVLAAQHLSEENPIEAKRICDMVLTAQPNHAAALNVLGSISLQEGDVESAIQLFERSLQDHDQFWQVWNNLGLACLQGKSFERATQAFENTVALNPDHTTSWGNLIQCLVACEEHQRAIQIAQDRLKDHPNDINVLVLLARISTTTGQYNIAFTALQKLLDLKPEAATDIKLEIAALLIAANFPGRAKKWIEEVMLAEPENKAALWVYGEMLKQSGLVEKAIEYFEASCDGQEISPKNKLSLAHTYTDLNRTKEAKVLLDEILVAEPFNISALVLAAQIQDSGLTSEQVARLQEMAHTMVELPQRRENIEYALAYTAEAKKEHVTAFQHYRKANALHKASLEAQKKGYNRKSVEYKFKQIKRVFTPELITRLSAFGNPSKVPVFIVGMPRSGTTLSERVIGNHSKAAGVGELMDIPHLSLLIREFSQSKKKYPHCLPELDEKYIPILAEGYLKRLQDWEPQADRIVNKLPGNFLFVGLIRILFPNAAIIHCVRDPRDTLISCFFARFGAGLAYSFDLKDGAHQYALYQDMMEYWTNLFPNDMYTSLYSDIVTQPEQAITTLLAHCGLDWEEECLNFHTSKKAVRTASRMQVRKPIYTSSLERWRRYEGHIDEIQHLSLSPKGQG